MKNYHNNGNEQGKEYFNFLDEFSSYIVSSKSNCFCPALHLVLYSITSVMAVQGHNIMGAQIRKNHGQLTFKIVQGDTK